MTLSPWDRWLLVLMPVILSLFAARGVLHFFQLESYQFPGFFRTLRRNPVHSLLPGVLAAVCSLLVYYLFDWFVMRTTAVMARVTLYIVILPFSAGVGMVIAKAFSSRREKKKLVYTSRLKRLYAVFFVVMTAIGLAVTGLSVSWRWELNALLPAILPLWVALAGLLAWPIEKAISEMYFRDARDKLMQNPRLIRIGITGSYGKTSVKHILGTILGEKYPTLITPASYNTPMGVTRAIREKLEPSHMVFIAEMGARHVGDIREMCRLVHPTIGVVTSVGPQHLETFKTVERVAKTKYELIEALPQQNAHAYFYDDGAYVKAMYDRTRKPKTLCGMDGETAGCWCDGVRVSAEGSAFTLHIAGKGEVECHTRLLGEHNIHNILLASAVAADLGLSLRQIAHGIQKLAPVANRLELMRSPGSFTIINDAFNANPIGAKAALDVLAQFPKRRIVITPGMVELGEREAEYNRDFGRQIAASADVAIIVGKGRAAPIIEGLRQAGFPEEHIHRVDSLDDSTTLLHRLVQPADTVLYENDLPDHYQEA